MNFYRIYIYPLYLNVGRLLRHYILVNKVLHSKSMAQLTSVLSQVFMQCVQTKSTTGLGLCGMSL